MSQERDQGRSGTHRDGIRTQRRYDPAVQNAFERLVADYKATSLMGIVQMLEHEPEVAGKPLPAVRTLRRHYKELHAPDHSGPWRMSDSDADDVPLIVSTIAALNQRSGVTSITFDEAKWLSRLRVQTADMPLWPRWRLAWLCRLREARGEPMEDLTLFVGYAPWRSKEAADEYRAAITGGLVPRAPALVYADLETMTHADLETMTYGDLEGLMNG